MVALFVACAGAYAAEDLLYPAAKEIVVDRVVSVVVKMIIVLMGIAMVIV